LRSMWLGRVVMTGLAVFAALSVGAGPVWGSVGHGFAGEFGGLGGGDGQFGQPLQNGPTGIGVMASGDVLTADEGQGVTSSAPRVQRFSQAGAFASAFLLDSSYAGGISSIAVDPAGPGAVYVATGFNGGVPSVAKYTATGVSAGTLVDVLDPGLTTSVNAGAQVAVDPANGTVYATAIDNTTGAPVIDSFDPVSGALISAIDGSTSPDGAFACSASSLAVDGSHRIYVLDPCKGRVDQFSAAGVFGGTVDDGVTRGAVSAVGVDPVSGEVYVSEAGPVGLQITQFSAGGTAAIYTFDASNVKGVRAMAVGGDGTVYTSDASRPVVERFTPFDGPTVTTDAAIAVAERTATLQGSVNPEGVATTYHFEYGTDLTYGLRTAESDAGTGGVPVAASAEVSQLDPNLDYHYRIVASNSAGSIVGDDQQLHTLTAPASMDPSPPFASVITPRSAKLHASSNPNRNPFVSWHFDWGTSTAYGSTATALTSAGFPTCVGCGGVDMPLVGQISGLEPSTAYHFRLVADPDGLGGTQQGEDQTFITAPAAGASASDVTTKRATFVGTIDPHGASATYHFNYGLTSSYGSTTPEADGGTGDGERVVSQAVAGLLPDRIYHVQVVTTSGGATRYGGDGLFRTAEAPAAKALGPTSVTTDSAVLVGDIDTHGMAGTYHFDVSSLDSSYSIATGERPVAGGASVQRVTAGLSGLPAGETFVVALTVSSNDSTQVSDLATFATAAVPRLYPTVRTDGTTAYGCDAPRLDAYNGRPKPGDTITISGRDLGLGGNVTLADRPVLASGWSASGFKLQVPDDESGTVALTIDCGRRSNTIAVALVHKIDNRFAVTSRSVSGSTATLAVKVPGPGKLQSSAAGTKAAKVTIKRPGSVTIKVKLSALGARALRRAKDNTLKVAVGLRFTPAGGASASKTVTVTFKRKAKR
jgi:hypothetical protein